MKIKKLSKIEKVSVGLIIASMGLFPYGILAANIPVEVIGIACMGLGCLIGVIFDMRQRRAKIA